jgi:hypothetical protein
MANFAITFGGVTAAGAEEIRDAIAYVYGVEANATGVRQALADNFIRPVLDSYRQRRVDADLTKPVADFGPDLGDAP